MKCPFCQYTKTEVYNSRQSKEQAHIWRRRRCKNCEAPFTTYEIPDMKFLQITDQNNQIQPYRRTKLINSLWQACGGLDEHIDEAEALVATIEHALMGRGQTLISTNDITESALATLKRYDMASFMRYLSQRSDFSSIEQLRHELQNI